MTKNRKKEGVIETDSGLQYLIIEEGDGEKPDAGAVITVHQRCQLIYFTFGFREKFEKEERSLRRYNPTIEKRACRGAPGFDQ